MALFDGQAAHHARHEAELGGYVAAAAAENLVQQGRSVIGGLVGMAAADVAFVEVVQQHFARALEAGHGDLDLSATYLAH